MRIGELAGVVGLKTSAIRYYEEIGLIPPPERSGSGYRTYTDEDVRRLRLIQQARMLSLPIDEIREIVAYAVDGRCATLKAEFLAALKERLTETRRQMRELAALRSELTRLCDDLSTGACAPAAEDVSSQGPCSCLDALATNDLLAPLGPEGAKVADGKGGVLMADKLKKADKSEPKHCGCGCVAKKGTEKKTKTKK